jgi:hypothetical protein
VAAFCGRVVAPGFAAFREAFTGAFLAAVFFAARFLATVGVRFLRGMERRPALLGGLYNGSFASGAQILLRFGASDAAAAGDVFLDSAHRFRWASGNPGTTSGSYFTPFAFWILRRGGGLRGLRAGDACFPCCRARLRT